jgi:hypothetical protein
VGRIPLDSQIIDEFFTIPEPESGGKAFILPGKGFGLWNEVALPRGFREVIYVLFAAFSYFSGILYPPGEPVFLRT